MDSDGQLCDFPMFAHIPMIPGMYHIAGFPVIPGADGIAPIFRNKVRACLREHRFGGVDLCTHFGGHQTAESVFCTTRI